MYGFHEKVRPMRWSTSCCLFGILENPVGCDSHSAWFSETYYMPSLLDYRQLKYPALYPKLLLITVVVPWHSVEPLISVEDLEDYHNSDVLMTSPTLQLEQLEANKMEKLPNANHLILCSADHIMQCKKTNGNGRQLRIISRIDSIFATRCACCFRWETFVYLVFAIHLKQSCPYRFLYSDLSTASFVPTTWHVK